MAERFSDPLFEKVGRLSVKGYCIWLEYFDMEDPHTDTIEPKSAVQRIKEEYEARGGYVF